MYVYVSMEYDWHSIAKMPVVGRRLLADKPSYQIYLSSPVCSLYYVYDFEYRKALLCQ